jgi:beta-lactamase class A
MKRLVFVICLIATAFADDKLAARYEQIAKQARGRVGAASVVLEGGEETCIRCDEHFPMQSVYKFPIAWTVLNQVDTGRLKLDQKVLVSKREYLGEGAVSPLRDRAKDKDQTVELRELLELAVVKSDGTASDVLMRLLNDQAKATSDPYSAGAKEVMRFLASVGVDGTGINVQDPEMALQKDWQVQYRNWMSPRGALKLLRSFHEGKGLSKESHAILRDMLQRSVNGDRRLKGLLPKETLMAHKTGTSGSRNGVTAATNDIGIITLPNGKRLAVAVFVSDAKADDVTRERTIARIAKEAWNRANAFAVYEKWMEN